ncbi:MAG: LPP20 family lipoprotein [Thiotrichales bacterium]|nr:LPP20 family lipoprotein [Thiotrichales bacterium]
MKNRTLLFAGIISAATLTGCASTSLMPNATNSAPAAAAAQPAAPMAVAQVTYKKPERIKIAGIGYGAESTFSAYTPGQRRLMAIRASKLDAYRALAEQLYGIKIDSNTAISTLTAKNDSFRARVNAVVRGARVVSVTPMADNNYETVLEVYVDQRFFDDTFVYSSANEQGVLTPAEVCVQCRDASSY